MARSGWCQPAPGAHVSKSAHVICATRRAGGYVTCDCPCHDDEEVPRALSERR